MAAQMQHGLLVLADISGFTSFVAQAELEHAHDILGELLELLVNRLTPTFGLVEIEGDAVYVSAPEASVPRGETLLELYESTYAAFKDRVEAVRRRTTCTCNACRLMPTLDVKFITTCGDYIVQSIAGSNKPVGSAVNLVHRLSKNHVAEATGWRAYALFTEAALTHSCISPDGMHLQVETYEHLGTVNTYCLDLLSRYRKMVEARRIFVSREEADWALTLDLPAPAPVVWDFLNDPAKRSLWDRNEIRPEKSDARRGIGSRNHCIHGKNSERLQTILDWRPFDYYTMDDRPSTSDKTEIMMTFQLIPTASGTQLNIHLKMLMPVPTPVRRPLCSFMMRFMRVEQNFRNLEQVIVAEQGKRATLPALA